MLWSLITPGVDAFLRCLCFRSFWGTFSWAVSFFRVEWEMRGRNLPQMSIHWSHWQWVGLALRWCQREPFECFEHSGDAKLALNYWQRWDSNEMSLGGWRRDITDCHVGRPLTRWSCLQHSCPRVAAGRRVGPDGRTAARRWNVIFLRERDG